MHSCFQSWAVDCWTTKSSFCCIKSSFLSWWAARQTFCKCRISAYKRSTRWEGTRTAALVCKIWKLVEILHVQLKDRPHPPHSQICVFKRIAQLGCLMLLPYQGQNYCSKRAFPSQQTALLILHHLYMDSLWWQIRSKNSSSLQ